MEDCLLPPQQYYEEVYCRMLLFQKQQSNQSSASLAFHRDSAGGHGAVDGSRAVMGEGETEHRHTKLDKSLSLAYYNHLLAEAEHGYQQVLGRIEATAGRICRAHTDHAGRLRAEAEGVCSHLEAVRQERAAKSREEDKAVLDNMFKHIMWDRRHHFEQQHDHVQGPSVTDAVDGYWRSDESLQDDHHDQQSYQPTITGMQHHQSMLSPSSASGSRGAPVFIAASGMSSSSTTTALHHHYPHHHRQQLHHHSTGGNSRDQVMSLGYKPTGAQLLRDKETSVAERLLKIRPVLYGSCRKTFNASDNNADSVDQDNNGIQQRVFAPTAENDKNNNPVPLYKDDEGDGNDAVCGGNQGTKIGIDRLTTSESYAGQIKKSVEHLSSTFHQQNAAPRFSPSWIGDSISRRVQAGSASRVSYHKNGGINAMNMNVNYPNSRDVHEGNSFSVGDNDGIRQCQKSVVKIGPQD